MTNEIREHLSCCHIYLNQVEMMLQLGQPFKAEFNAKELSERAKLLSNALYRLQRRSGEVSNEPMADGTKESGIHTAR